MATARKTELLRAGERHRQVLRHGDYKPARPDSRGVHESRVFPGLWLDAVALFRPDRSRVIAVLQEGLRSPEHAAYCDELRRRMLGPP